VQASSPGPPEQPTVGEGAVPASSPGPPEQPTVGEGAVQAASPGPPEQPTVGKGAVQAPSSARPPAVINVSVSELLASPMRLTRSKAHRLVSCAACGSSSDTSAHEPSSESETEVSLDDQVKIGSSDSDDSTESSENADSNQFDESDINWQPHAREGQPFHEFTDEFWDAEFDSVVDCFRGDLAGSRVFLFPFVTTHLSIRAINWIQSMFLHYRATSTQQGHYSQRKHSTVHWKWVHVPYCPWRGGGQNSPNILN
jgi:hypothetical protein